MPHIFFDLDQVEKGHRTEIEGRLAIAETKARSVKIAATRSHADWIVSFHGTGLLEPVSQLLRSKLRDGFIWDASDFPTGLAPGLYCSLPSTLFSGKVHRAFNYTVRYNECIRPFDIEDATRLYSFVGGITSGLRARMAKGLVAGTTSTTAEFRISSGPWNSMFDRSATTIKMQYAESFRQAKFILCPRGNGVSSIRMFEAMEARRVPVILSDHYVFPEGVDWKSCALVIRENDFLRLPKILRDAEPRWESMATAARQAWEARFSDAVMLDEIARQLSTLQHSRLWWTKPACLALRTKMRVKQILPALVNRLHRGICAQ